jgi:tetratricopeptide (TPR) repeat protein
MKRYIFSLLPYLLLILYLGSTGYCWGDDEEDRAYQLNDFGLLCMQKALWLEAEYRFKQSLEILDDSAIIHNNLAVCLEAQNRLDEAYEEYNKANELNPEDEDIYENLVDFLEIHKYEED